MSTIAITGHRPDKLGGYSSNNPYRFAVIDFLLSVHEQHPDARFVSGMALGVDQWAAEAFVKAGARWTAAIPCYTQANQWPQLSRSHYLHLLSKANHIHVVREAYSRTCMQERNEWMVDNSDLLLAFWDGTPGGTANCYRYAVSKGRAVVRINPNDLVRS